MKDIKNFEGLYAVTSCGRVWSYKRNKFLTPYNNGCGYLKVSLLKDGIKHRCAVHRLVAEAYIPNPDNKPQVNHKNENKHDNCVTNLEWMTSKENNNYGTRNQRIMKPVYCIELSTTFPSGTQAARELNINQAGISKCCKGTQKIAGGYHWEYAERGGVA